MSSDFGEESDQAESPHYTPYEIFTKISDEVLTQLENAKRTLSTVGYIDYKDYELNEMLQMFKKLNRMKQYLYVIDMAVNYIIYEFRNIADFTNDGVVIKIKDFQFVGSTLPMANALYSCLKNAPSIKDLNDLIIKLSDETKVIEERQRELFKMEGVLNRQREQLYDFINSRGCEPIIDGIEK